MENIVLRTSTRLSSSHQKKIRHQQSTIVSSICRICGATARYSYYGAIVCHSCKMFFRRHAESEQRIDKCQSNHQCEINVETRRLCSSCRLDKCFANGMSTQMIRCPRTKQININRNKQNRASVSNLLQLNYSSMAVAQWNLLSKLVHCVEEQNVLSFVNHFIDQQNCLPVKLRFRSSSIIDFANIIASQAQLTIEKIRDFHCLSSNDRSILLRNTANYTSVVTVVFILRQSSLVTNPSFFESCINVFGCSSVTLVRTILEQFDCDPILTKLILSFIAFSTTNLTKYIGQQAEYLINWKSVVAIQDMYVELAWRYLLHKCGEIEGIKRFSRLTQCLVMFNNVLVEVENCQQLKDIINYVQHSNKSH